MAKYLFFTVMAVGALMLIGCVTARGVYLNENGSTFTRNFSGLITADVPSSFYEDIFLQSEIVRTFRENKTQTYQEPSWSGVRSVSRKGEDRNEAPIIGRTYQIVETYDVTVTRYWYNRTTYYQDRKPAYSKVYKDEAIRRLINTEKKYLN
jgi:hypothetical protein